MKMKMVNSGFKGLNINMWSSLNQSASLGLLEVLDLKKLGYASLNHNIHIAADPLLLRLLMLHMRAIALCAHNVCSANHDEPPTLSCLVKLSPDQTYTLNIHNIHMEYTQHTHGTYTLNIHIGHRPTTIHNYSTDYAYIFLKCTHPKKIVKRKTSALIEHTIL